jgi:trimethylamine--corrinoid protein Co-methyltransferase
LVICNEIVGWLEHVVAPFEINEATLALDLIDEIGPDGQFLDSEHTMAHYRERWYPEVFERANYDQWKAAGGTDLGERAAARVERILAERRPEPLPTDLAEKIAAVVTRAEETFGIG